MSEGPDPSAIDPAQPAPGKPNAFQRLIGVLFSPDETFASIARQPDWVVPLILFVVLSAISGFIIANHVDFAAPAREQMEAQGKLTPDQIAAQVKVIQAVSKVFAYCAPVMTMIALLIVAAVLMLAYRLMGGEGTFKQYFSVTLYAWVPQFILGLITAGILATRTEPVDAQELPTLVRSNPAFLVDLHQHKVLFSLLSSLDVFVIWSVILMIIGFAYVARVSKAKSAGIMITVWGMYTAIKLAFVALGAMMGSRK
jgi:hypothetical protein